MENYFNQETKRLSFRKLRKKHIENWTEFFETNEWFDN